MPQSEEWRGGDGGSWECAAVKGLKMGSETTGDVSPAAAVVVCR